MAETLISHHVFIFPFCWDAFTTGGITSDNPFSERTDLSLIHKKIGAESSARINTITLTWERFKFDWVRDYNEAIYFHPYVWDALFDDGGNQPHIGLQYHISGKGKNLEYRITIEGSNGAQVRHLEIEEITLNFYETGIGFLGFHLNNYSHNTPEEILQINDFGRRIFPQFLGRTDEVNRLSDPKSIFLADKIELFSDKAPITKDDFSGTLTAIAQASDGHCGWLIPKFIWDLLPDFIQPASTLSAEDSIQISPLLDDRMFLVCWVGHDKWSDALIFNEQDKPHENEAHWHSLIFVDGKEPGMKNDDLLRRLTIAHTSDRWGGYGTFYGASRYSLVALSGSDFGRNYILPHTKTMYFQIALLCLLQRGSIVRFSNEIAKLTTPRSISVDRAKESACLYEKYLHYINKVYFREVTTQEQGIELYKLLQEKMEIERDVKNLQTEIQDFFNLLKLQNDELKLQSDKHQTDALNTVTVVGAALLAPTLILAYFGISAFPDIATGFLQWFVICASLLAIAGSITALRAALAWIRGQKQIARNWIIGTVTTFILAVCLPLFFPKQHDPVLQDIHYDLHQIWKQVVPADSAASEQYKPR